MRQSTMNKGIKNTLWKKNRYRIEPNAAVLREIITDFIRPNRFST